MRMFWAWQIKPRDMWNVKHVESKNSLHAIHVYWHWQQDVLQLIEQQEQEYVYKRHHAIIHVLRHWKHVQFIFMSRNAQKLNKEIRDQSVVIFLIWRLSMKPFMKQDISALLQLHVVKGSWHHAHHQQVVVVEGLKWGEIGWVVSS